MTSRLSGTTARTTVHLTAICLAAALAVSPMAALAQGTAPSAGQQAAIAADPVGTEIMRQIAEVAPDSNVEHFYKNRGYAPVWIDGDVLSERGHLAIAAFAAANEHALNPENYGPFALATRAEGASSPAAWARLELELSLQFIRYATHLSSGRVQPNAVNKALNIFPHVPNPAELLQDAIEVEDFSAFLEGLAPNTPNYARLKRRLGEYRDKAALGGFSIVPSGEVLKPGMSDERLEILRQRLIEEDYLAAGSHSGDLYDGTLVDAVKTFQAYHGLEEDGVIGKNTLAELNVPIEKRLIQMELNMERRRWMPDYLGNTYVFVNLADQNLKVVRKGKTWHTARVVVGKPYHATPVFSKEMTYVEVNPYWNVPYSIATKEYLPKLIKNANALSSQNIRVFNGSTEMSASSIPWSNYSRANFPFKLRQDPGPKNALGHIKFMFPNQFNIYIHDTPSKGLFNRAQRSFSHGCIRVSDPFMLGEMILIDQGFDKAKLEALKAQGKRKVISLKDPVPVHLTYLTAWMNKDGSTHFRRDIYGRDEVLLKALAKAMTDNL